MKDGTGRSAAAQSIFGAPRAGRVERDERLCRALRVLFGEERLLLPVRLREGLPSGAEKAAHDAHGARGVVDVDDGPPVGRGDLHGRVDGARRRAADQERQGEALALHLARDVRHLLEGRRDEAREAHGVDGALPRGLQDPVRRHHDAEVDHLVAVAREDDADDVLPDVVDVALDRREEDPALRRRRPGGLVGLKKRLEIRDGALHDARALDDLRQEHLPGAEEVADDVHARHERALDDVERPGERLAGLLGVALDEVRDAVDEGVREALPDGPAPPRVGLRLGGACLLDGLGEREQPLGRVAPAVQEDVLDPFEEVLRDVLVDGELARVHDSHVEAGADRVVQERRVHRLADRVVAAERERHVRDPAGDLRERERLLDAARRLEEVDGVGIVLLDARRDRQDVRVEDDVLGRETHVLGEDPVRPPRDRDLPLDRRRLPLLVERHHDHGRAVAADEPGVGPEHVLALLEAEGVDDGLALQAPQARLDHVPLRAVEHDRELRDVRLGRHEVEEPRHRGHAVEHPLVHADVEDVRAALDLLPRDGERALVVAREDELRELRRARHVRPLADDREDAFAQRVRLEAGEAGRAGDLGDAPRRDVLHGLGDRPDVVRRRPAAAAHDVHPARAGERGEVGAHDLGRLVEAAERVRQAGVRVGAREDRREARQLLDVRPHLPGPERAVDPDREERGVRDRVPERLDELARERPARFVRDRDRDHQRHAPRALVEELLRREQRRLEDERVEDRLEEEDVGAAVEQAPDLVPVRGGHLREDVRALARVVDVHREGERPVRRPERARDEGVAARGGPVGVDGLAREARGGDVHLVRERLEAVVREGDRLRVERVRLDDVRAGRKVGPVDPLDDRGLREDEEVVRALEVPRVGPEAVPAVRGLVQPLALDHRPHRAVDDGDPPREERA